MKVVVIPYLIITLLATILSLFFPLEPSPLPPPQTQGIATTSAERAVPSHGGVIAFVTEVVDGDTIKVDTGHTVRYIGMDTPEVHHPKKGQECFGQEAKEKNRALVEHAHVELVKDVSETDRYGRLLRYVWKNDVLVNDLLVREGYAVARSYPPDIARQEMLRLSESLAAQARLGLWGDVCRP